MSIPAVFAALNGAVSDGVVRAYAIGGAVGALFYIEVTATEDIDVFVLLAVDDPNALDAFASVWGYFTSRGASFDGEYIVIAGRKVQFLPAPDRLHTQAIDTARQFDADGIPVRVMTAEYLALLALKVGRAKDKVRIAALVALQEFDLSLFESLVEEHDLRAKWTTYRETFLTEPGNP